MREKLAANGIDTIRIQTVLLGVAFGGIMTDEMGSFRVDVEIEKPFSPGSRRLVSSVLIDTGVELSFFPAAVLESLGIPHMQRRRFRQADGSSFERWSGPAYVFVAGAWTVDEVVFAEPGDMTLLGSRSLEGLNLQIDPVAKRLIDAGPIIVAAAA